MHKILLALLGLVLAVGILYVGVLGLSIASTWFLSLAPESLTPMAALLGVLLVPIITYFTSRGLERRRSRENAIREHKTKLYDQMMRGLLRMLNLRKGDPMTSAEMVALFADVTPPMISYGSRGVIRAWNDFRRVSRETATGDETPMPPSDTRTLMLAFENLLKAMRQDLGHSVFTHQPGELLGVFINDVDIVVKKPRTTLPAIR